MSNRNNGINEADILQNQFTAYLITAFRRSKNQYRRKIIRKAIHELSLEEENLAGITPTDPCACFYSPKRDGGIFPELDTLSEALDRTGSPLVLVAF